VDYSRCRQLANSNLHRTKAFTFSGFSHLLPLSSASTPPSKTVEAFPLIDGDYGSNLDSLDRNKQKPGLEFPIAFSIPQRFRKGAQQMTTQLLPLFQIVVARHIRILALCLLLPCTLGLCLSASAQEGTFITFDPPGSTGTQVNSINPAGLITGYFFEGNNSHGFVRSREGTFTIFNGPEATFTLPESINPQGAITGYYITASFGQHGFLRAPDGTLTTFDPPGSTATGPASINPAGAITGYYIDASFALHGFLRSPDGRFTTFDGPGSTFTLAVGINPEGAIAGYYTDASGVVHSFLRDPDGTPTAPSQPSMARARFLPSPQASTLRRRLQEATPTRIMLFMASCVPAAAPSKPLMFRVRSTLPPPASTPLGRFPASTITQTL